MSCPSETDASRWGEALATPGGCAEGEAVYAGWDCPQVGTGHVAVGVYGDEIKTPVQLHFYP